MVWVSRITKMRHFLNIIKRLLLLLGFLMLLALVTSIIIDDKFKGKSLVITSLLFISTILVFLIQKAKKKYLREKKEKIKTEIDFLERKLEDKMLLQEASFDIDSENEDRKRLIEILTDISGVSDRISRTILDQFPTFESIDNGSEKDISQVPGVGKNVARAVKARIRNIKKQ